MKPTSKRPQSLPGAGDILGAPPAEQAPPVGQQAEASTGASPALSRAQMRDRTGGEDVEKAAMTFVIEQGGSIAEAEKAIEALRSGPAALFVRRTGSVDEALRILRQLADRLPSATSGPSA